jgi:Type II secretion system (T2SS), protein G
MTNASIPDRKGGWKQIAWLATMVAGVPILMLVCGALYFAYDEGNQVYRARLYRAKYDITAIETAAESFHKRYGSYPTDLQELTNTARYGGDNTRFLTRIASDPWGGSFHYAVEHGVNGESIKIWAVPDRRTQDKLRMPEVSNRSDWQAILK